MIYNNDTEEFENWGNLPRLPKNLTNLIYKYIKCLNNINIELFEYLIENYNISDNEGGDLINIFLGEYMLRGRYSYGLNRIQYEAYLLKRYDINKLDDLFDINYYEYKKAKIKEYNLYTKKNILKFIRKINKEEIYAKFAIKNYSKLRKKDLILKLINSNKIANMNYLKFMK